jgi:putative membrane protein insertion efficiency factor
MKFVALWLLRAYKRWLSPAFPPSCRYVPTCSEYAMEAVERYGALRGGAMAAWRLLRCHPFVKGGYDPVVKGSTHTDNCRAALGWTAEGGRPYV